MDELEAAVFHPNEPDQPKRRTGYRRMKERCKFLSDDIASLESLVETLLSHLERATEPGVTELERVRFRNMVNEVRGHLTTDEAA